MSLDLQDQQVLLAQQVPTRLLLARLDQLVPKVKIHLLLDQQAPQDLLDPKVRTLLSQGLLDLLDLRALTPT